ncbi:DivIVA domain-containing protein [Canibacter sp. lx-72]|uniref:DivIVA domain-containing protein n=1 Tax=Canibacter zhuwentaonis TaxID=2837491 RepID=UPI001BDC58A8|nr:DivIVA domain-containing protein [Canibacter zhuwentaonis]MBT1017683.1 DivIVA domain-containing protein [Canibacter zhuwentaonis]
MTSSETDNRLPLVTGRELGYDVQQVNEFLARARETYEGADRSANRLTSQDLRKTSFDLVKRGYATRFVDAALDRIEDVLYERERAELLSDVDARRMSNAAIVHLVQDVKFRAGLRKRRKFRRRGIFASGYNCVEVDSLVEQAVQALGQRVTVAQLRESVFHRQWRGYDEAQVDAFIDALVELYLYQR